MTALCPGGGPSGTNGVAPVATFITGAELVSLVTKTLNLTNPWPLLLSYLAGEYINLSQFCTTDPPPMPVFQPLDPYAIVFNNDAASPGAIQRGNDLVHIAAWYAFCECTNAMTPAPPAAPAYPPTGLVPNPPTLPELTQQPCWNVSQSFGVSVQSAACPVADITRFMVPGAQTCASGQVYACQPATPAACMPTGVSNLHWHVDGVGTPPGPSTDFILWDATGTLISRSNFEMNVSGASTDRVISVPANAVGWTVNLAPFFGGPGSLQGSFWGVNEQVSFYCANQGPSSPIAPCCPPDPSLIGQLQQIFNQLNFIAQGLPVPLHSYAHSTVHSGLQGSGVFAIGANVLAVLVDVTTIPPRLGSTVGTPPYFYNLGFITPEIAGTPYQPQRLTYQHQQFLLPALSDAVTFTLTAGVVANITELVRGP
jgi:hypothetical protein